MSSAHFDYDWLVVGSGFGGSVSALRLAEKGYRVGVLERGRRYTEADLPKGTSDRRTFLWAPALQTYQHLLPGMQEDAASTVERLTRPKHNDAMERGGNSRKKSAQAVGTPLERRKPRLLTWAFAFQMVAGAGFEPATFGL